MVAPRKYPLSDVKILYGLASGRCAFPNCRRELILDPVPGDCRKQIGKIAHIVGHSGGGPRADPSYPQGKLDTYHNWILLCPTCHDIVDALNSAYTIADLRGIKTEHELWVRKSLVAEFLGIGFPELEVAANAIMAGAASPSEDFVIVAPRDKMRRNDLANATHMLLTMGLSKGHEVRDFVQSMSLLDHEFPERMKAGFTKEYLRLRESGLLGGGLFEAMRQFSCGGSSDFKRQAAGLAILCYLFESCEVFEK